MTDMTRDEYARGLEDIAVRQGVERAKSARTERLAAGRYSREDLVDALDDYIGELVGDPSSDPHPLARHLHRDSSLRRVLYEYHGADTAQDLHRALSLSDWPQLIATRITRAVTQRPSGLTEHRALVLPAPLDTYHPSAFFETASSDAIAPIPTGGGPWPIPEIDISDATVTGAPSRYAVRVAIGRALFLTASLSPVEALVTELRNVLLRAETKAFSTYLESAPQLGDGNPLFVDGTNAIASGSGGEPSATTIGVALQTLRTQANAAGARNGVRGKYLAVPPALEATALTALGAIDPHDRRGLQVVVLPYASSSTAWWLFAAPREAASIARLSVGDAVDPVVETRPVPMQDAVDFRAAVDFGFIALSRAGCFYNPGA